MKTLLATPEMKKWMGQNLAKFAVNPSSKSITDQYQAKTSKGEHFIIKVYTTNTVTIQGNIEERIYETLFKQVNETNHYGCDEVGVGDFLGPTVYVACKLTTDSINKLAKLGLSIRDSKKLKDDEIKDIYAKTKEVVDYEAQIVYDRDIDGLNSIAQKVNYHFENVIDAFDETVIIDLFTTENSFYKYSQELDIEWPEKLILETKADGTYMSVALASIIARAIFLEEMAKLEAKYDFKLPLGAGALPKAAASEFVKRYSKEELSTFCKTSFKTFNEI